MKEFLIGLCIGLCLALISTFAFAQDAWLPDPDITPGVTNPAVTQDTIHQTICVSGWTATVRPPLSVTNKLKAQQIAEYGYTDTNLKHYEEDHWCGIEDGCSPTDPKNLWPMPYAGPCGARTKDKLETRIKRLICAGTITLEEGRAAFLDTNDWTIAYRKYVGPLSCPAQ